MTDPVAVAGHSGAKVELDRAELTARLFHEHGDRLVGLAAAKRFVPLAARAGPEEIVELRDEQRRVVEAVRQLPTRQRECLVLRYYDDLSDGEIAETLRLSVTSVRTHLRRGKASLAQRLDPRSGRTS